MAGHERIRGIFTPNMVPLDEQDRINEPELRRYVDWLIDRGVHGLYPNGSTGEFTRFTPDERRRIVQIMADQTAGRVPILAGAAEANVRETLKVCEYYRGLGVRAVAIVSPYYYNLSPDNVYAYFKEIGRNTPIDVTLYNIPMFASPIDVPTIQRLSEECERIVAIKDSSGDIPQMMRMIEAVRPNRPDFSFLTGIDAVLMPMLLIGCDGGTNVTSGVVPEVIRRLYETTTAGQIDEARELQYQIRRIFDALLYEADFPEACRVALELRGIRMGPGKQPLSDEHKVKLENLRPKLRQLYAESGVRNAPVATPVPISPQEIGQVVASVLTTLQQQGV
jgi:dihydrodipicolinate synthase/N-acetylneuraminate lyase